MPRSVRQAKQFKKDLKRKVLTALELDRLKEAVRLLAQAKPLPRDMRDHDLLGNHKGYRECHLSGDTLLIYKLAEEEVRLARIGSHAELFG